jgi:hypothetical protein
VEVIFKNVASDSGTAVADNNNDTLTIVGAGSVTTAVVGDTLTITGTDDNENYYVSGASQSGGTLTLTRNGLSTLQATGFTNASNSQTFTNKSGNISQWTNDSGYITSGSLPTVNNATITLTAGTGLSGGGTITLNQASNETVTFNNSITNNNQLTNGAGYTTNTGTVTSVATGDGLSGGTITSTGTLTVDSTVVRTTGTQSIGGVKTFTSNTTFNGYLRGSGQQLVLNAGESYSVATGQTNELVYLNAEGGIQINSSPDNWSSGWAGRKTTTINDSSGNSTFANDITVSGGDITLGGTGRIQGVDTVSSGTDAANKTYVDNAMVI